jgi:CTP synthase
LITRSETGLDKPRRETLAKRCFLDDDAIFDDPDCESIYEVPLLLKKQGYLKKIFRHFKIEERKADLYDWEKLLKKQKGEAVRIALVGKYVRHGKGNHKDVYVSVLEALKHGAIANGVKMTVEAIDSNDYKVGDLKKYQGIVVPQGWGSRGVEGIIEAVKYARENKIPYLGLCFGMQMAVIEYARNVLGLKGANSVEVDEKTKYPVINIMPDQAEYLKKHQYGGTIRLGTWPCRIKKGSLLEKIYSGVIARNETTKQSLKDRYASLAMTVNERHRHRYEVNNEFREKLEKVGMVISGTSPDGKLVEAIELPDQPFFVGTQFHPEYKSRPLDPHPIFVEFVKAAKGK